MPHCSLAKNVPVRPKPVATSSAMSSTPVSRQAVATRATWLGLGDEHAGRALHEWLEHDGGERVGVSVDRVSTASSAHAGSSYPGDAVHVESQRIEHLRAEPTGAERDRADRVPVVRVPECEVGPSSVLPLVRPVLEGDLQGLLDGGRAIGREQQMRIANR